MRGLILYCQTLPPPARPAAAKMDAMTERHLEVFQLPGLFSDFEIVVTFHDFHIGSTAAQADEDVEAVRDRLLCHLVKHAIGEVVKSINLAAATEAQREACAQLRGALPSLRTGGDLQAIQQFVDDHKVHIRAIVPPPNHRLYRSCKTKSEFVLAVGEYAPAPASSQAAGAS